MPTSALILGESGGRLEGDGDGLAEEAAQQGDDLLHSVFRSIASRRGVRLR